MGSSPPLTSEDAHEWFTDQIPGSWFTSVRTLVDRDEIFVIGTLAERSPEPDSADTPPADGAREHQEQATIEWFREETREDRIAIAQRAEAKFERKVSWGAGCGSEQAAFTHLSIPVMTRLRISERRTLDTLVSAGVARSRSDALGWCVRLVAEHEGDWLHELRDALGAVDRVRAQGPN